MKTHIFPAIKLTLLAFVLVVVLYSAVVWAVGLLTPGNGRGNNENIGQSFTDDKYFWSRPSAVGYNAAGSAGSNKGPSNPDYLAQVVVRVDTFLVHNPMVNRRDVPVDIVTASGSGLDPNISPKAALIQIPRIAEIRHLKTEQLKQLVNEYTETPLLGIFGTERVNVLKLNKALDRL